MKRHSQRHFGAALAVGALMWLTACGSGADESSQAAPTPSAGTAASSEAAVDPDALFMGDSAAPDTTPASTPSASTTPASSPSASTTPASTPGASTPGAPSTASPTSASGPVCPKSFFEIPAGAARGSDAPQSRPELLSAISLLAEPGTSWGCIYFLDGENDGTQSDGRWKRVAKPLKLKQKWANEAPMLAQVATSARPGKRATQCSPAQGTPYRFVYARRSAAGTAHVVADSFGCSDVRIVSTLGTRDLTHDDALVDLTVPATAEAVRELQARMVAG